MRIFLLLLVFLAPKMFAAEGDVILLTCERSGAHWLMYCMTQCTGKEWLEGGGSVPLKDIVYRGNPDLDPFLHCHNISLVQDEVANHPETKLLTIVRDYRECLIRHWNNALRAHQSFRKSNLFHNLSVYDKWDPDRRLMIYYEDFITDPESTLIEVMDFLGEGSKMIPSFMENFTYHKNRSLGFYDRKRAKSRTRGRDFHYHANRSNPKVLRSLENKVRSKNPYLYKKYLLRYE